MGSGLDGGRGGAAASDTLLPLRCLCLPGTNVFVPSGGQWAVQVPWCWRLAMLGVPLERGIMAMALGMS